MEKVRILLVDDHDILMDGIASLLNEAQHLKVIGKASSVDIAEELVRQLRPDVVLTDISMGERTGLDLTRFITQQFPLVKVIVLTMHDNAQHISALLEAGAMGYLLKSAKQDELVMAIKQVMAGQQYIQHSIAASYSRTLQQQQLAEKQSQLTPREVEIIRLIAQELTTAEISRQLFLSEFTVETHRKNIIRKTGVKSVVGLLNYAREHGLI